MASTKELGKKFKFYQAYAYSLVRSLNFTAQATCLRAVDRLATRQKREVPKNLQQYLIEALPKINQLLKRDAQNIADGYYPVKVLVSDRLIHHALRLPSVLHEAFNSSKRREKKISKKFDLDTENILSESPDYYARNFHFQNSGYLGKKSAELYEHQVEILFSGAANAMRRIMLVELKKRLHHTDGSGLHFLELGSGTGALTQFVAQAFPKANITCVDLSPYYLQQAKDKLSSLIRINFIKANAEDLPFKENTFDFVYSCFLFHEIPESIRNQVMKESIRVAKPKAQIAVVDSLQKNDDKDFLWALKQFPKDFHEPFYKNYTENPLELLFQKFGLQNVKTEIGFLTKSVMGELK